MDGQALRAAYAAFHATAASGPFRAPASPHKWSADYIVAHMVAIDHLLGATIAEVLAGRSPSHDNRPAIRTPHLRSIVAATDRAGLLAAARLSASVVCALVDDLSDEAAGRPLPLFLQSGDAVVFDGAMPLAQLLDAQARMHLPGHTRQIEALRA